MVQMSTLHLRGGQVYGVLRKIWIGSLYARAVTSACRRPWNWPFCTTQSQPYLQQLALALAQVSRLSLVGAHFTEACQCTWLGLQPQASALGVERLRGAPQQLKVSMLHPRGGHVSRTWKGWTGAYLCGSWGSNS